MEYEEEEAIKFVFQWPKIIKLNHGEIKEIIYSLEKFLNYFNKEHCEYLLACTIVYNKLDKLKLLFQYEKLAYYKKSALEIAIQSNQEEIIDYLIEYVDISEFSPIEIKEIVEASLTHKNMKVLQKLRSHQISYKQCQIENVEVKLGLIRIESQHTLCPEIVTELSPECVNKINEILQFLNKWKEDDLLLASLNQELPMNPPNVHPKI